MCIGRNSCEGNKHKALKSHLNCHRGLKLHVGVLWRENAPDIPAQLEVNRLLPASAGALKISGGRVAAGVRLGWALSPSPSERSATF